MDGANGDHVVWVIGFLSGFSERFVHDFVTQADRIAGAAPGTSGAANGAAAPKDPKG